MSLEDTDQNTLMSLAKILGDNTRNFKHDPITPAETSLIMTALFKELLKPDLEKDLRNLYGNILKILKEQVHH